jgi:hypothetical protein
MARAHENHETGGTPRVIYHVVFSRPLFADGRCYVCDEPYDALRCRLVQIVPAPPNADGIHGVATVDCHGIATGDVRPCPCGPRVEDPVP